jgi:geranylgeranyl reductase family protein
VRYDIVIVGGGPAGSSAAVAAARTGARVCVLDRARYPRPKTCGDAVSNEGSRVVDRMAGHADALQGIPHAIVREATAVFPDGTTVSRSFGEDIAYITPRLQLDDFLRAQAAEAGAEVKEGVAVRSLVIERGLVVGARSDKETWRGAAVIAADGPGSLSWAVLGLPYRRGRHLAVAITAYYEGIDVDTAEHYFEHDLESGYGWIFPAVDGVANVGVYQRADAFGRDARTLPRWLEAFIGRHPERFDRARRVGRPRAWALPLAVQLRPPGGSGLLVCGDAAYSVDPLSGEGIWQALWSGEEAAKVIVAALGERGLDRRSVQRYQRRWARAIGVGSLLRFGVQEAMNQAVARGLYRRSWFRRLLQRGYRTDAFEVSKKLR